MRYFEVQKPIRNKIKDKIENEGSEIIYRVMGKKEFTVEMMKKLEEEVVELRETDLQDRTKILDEVADVRTVLDSIMDNMGISEEELKKYMKSKKDKVGDFEERIFLERVGLDSKNDLVPYYEKNFKEIK